MTEEDKKFFDEIFKSCKYFCGVSDTDTLMTAGRCWKLFDYLQADGLTIEETRDIAKYMHFAYWLGVIEYKISNGIRR